MKAIIGDKYELMVNPKAKFPIEYKDYSPIWHLRDALFDIWAGNITTLAIPEKGLPGYDYEDYINSLVENGQLVSSPKIEYYTME